MGMLMRRRRSRLSEVKTSSTSTTTSSRRRSCPAVPATVNTNTSSSVRVRAKSICNSSNLNRLHSERQSSSSSSPVRAKRREDPWSEANLQEAIELWELDEKQVARLMYLKEELKDCAHHFKYDPHIILRFMTSPKGADTIPLFRKMIQWRLDNNVDPMLETYKPNQILLDYNPTAILRDYDRDGDPIYVERGGATDGPGMLKHFTKEEIMEYTIYTRELNTQGAWIQEYEKRQGRKVRDVTVVYDLKGLNAGHLNPSVLQFFGEVQHMNQTKYPGPLKRMIIIRAPSIFRYIWAMAKHFFPQSSRDKMIFAGKNYHKELEKYIELDVLPPCIYEHGKGCPAPGLPPRMEGGAIPDHVKRVDNNNNNNNKGSNASEDADTEAESPKTFLTLDSFDRTEQSSLASSGNESDTSFTST